MKQFIIAAAIAAFTLPAQQLTHQQLSVQSVSLKPRQITYLQTFL